MLILLRDITRIRLYKQQILLPIQTNLMSLAPIIIEYLEKVAKPETKLIKLLIQGMVKASYSFLLDYLGL